MNLRTWAGLGLARMALTLTLGLGFLSKSLGLAALQKTASFRRGVQRSCLTPGIPSFVDPREVPLGMLTSQITVHCMQAL